MTTARSTEKYEVIEWTGRNLKTLEDFLDEHTELRLHFTNTRPLYLWSQPVRQWVEVHPGDMVVASLSESTITVYEPDAYDASFEPV